MKREPVEGINPQMLIWARNTIGLSINDVSAKFKYKVKNIEAWESGQTAPSYAQLEKLAYIYKRPLASFFLATPPDEESPKQAFRTLPDLDMETLAPDTYRKIHLAHFFQISTSEIFENKNPSEKPIWKYLSLSVGRSIAEQAKEIRKFLGVDMQNQIKWIDEDTALKKWRMAIEDAGVFVFKDSFKQKDISGFCLRDEDFPIIYINNSTTKTRQIFSLFHELAHILFNKNGISKFDTDYIDKLSGEEKTSEKFCNSIAGEILVPEDDFLQLINNLSKKTKNISDDEYYEGIARRYKVSREVILRKLLDKGYVDQYFYKEKSNHWLRQMGNKKSGGGNYYLTQKTYLSNKFSREVINKYNENQISIEQASDMLNIKVKNFADLEQEILQGAAA